MTAEEIRALKADSHIEFRTEASDDQFRAILWRSTQKSDPNAEGSEKIISLLRANSKITISQLANELSISDCAVSKQLKKLQESHKIRRVGPDKGGL